MFSLVSFFLFSFQLYHLLGFSESILALCYPWDPSFLVKTLEVVYSWAGLPTLRYTSVIVLIEAQTQLEPGWGKGIWWQCARSIAERHSSYKIMNVWDNKGFALLAVKMANSWLRQFKMKEWKRSVCFLRYVKWSVSDHRLGGGELEKRGFGRDFSSS